MMDEAAAAPALAAAVSERTALLVETIRDANVDLLAPSRLEGWDRLTIVCHLRYGASALLRMTRDAVEGRPTAYYPEGRVSQRPGTLMPEPGEAPGAVVASLSEIADALDEEWARMPPQDWALEVVEPADNPDLGTVPLGRLAMARLLEVDVHGTDLGIGFPDWSELLVEVALRTRLGWLAARRTNHRSFDEAMRGSWLLVANDGPRWWIAVEGRRVESRPAGNADQPTATIEGSSRDLLALLLGRPTVHDLTIRGDTRSGPRFRRRFPAPDPHRQRQAAGGCPP